MIQYRLSWLSINSNYAAHLEDMFDKGVWSRLSDEDWAKLPWNEQRTVVVFSESEADRLRQHQTLTKWAKTRFQPIGDVTLEQREIPDDNTGWEPV